MTDKDVIKNIKRRYSDMMQRCYNENCCNYKHYGHRGISVCDEWNSDVNGMENFILWSLTNGYSRELSLDRIDNDGNYSPNNCRWTTRRIQNINKASSVKGKTGFVGINIHSSSTENNTYYYGRCKDGTGKTLYTGLSKDIKEAIMMRNNFIIANNLDNKLNVVPL